MKANRFVASTLAVIALSACSSAATETVSSTATVTPLTVAAPSTTVPSGALILGRLRAPVLEAFSATYRWGGSPLKSESVVVKQDAELNLFYSLNNPAASGAPVYQVILHDSIVYVRLNTKDGELAAEIQRGLGVPSGEWFPFEEWRLIGSEAALDYDYPQSYSATRWALSIADFNLLPYQARVLASHASRVQWPTPDSACFRVDREVLASGDLDAAKLQVRRTPENRWVLDGPCYLSVAFDDLGRMTSLTGSADEIGSENDYGYGVLAVTYGQQPAIEAPDTSWFKDNKDAVKKALKAAGVQADRDYEAEKARLG